MALLKKMYFCFRCLLGMTAISLFNDVVKPNNHILFQNIINSTCLSEMKENNELMIFPATFEAQRKYSHRILNNYVHINVVDPNDNIYEIVFVFHS